MLYWTWILTGNTNRLLLSMTFNIIYTPGTVRYLSCFIWSLLKHTRKPLRFRLISNGCHPKEQSFLASMCRQESRLEFYSIPNKKMLPHGLVLNYLQSKNRKEHFCFMDSDIFATGNFISDIDFRSSEYAGIFSGMPVWVRSDEQIFPPGFCSLTGMFNRNEAGLPLGSTFFAIYSNKILTEIMQSTGIGFEGYHWNEIPFTIQRDLAALDFKIKTYDTGKVLNLMFISREYELKNIDLHSICHVGGSSFQVFYDEQPKSFKRKMATTPIGQKLQWMIDPWLRRKSIKSYQHHYANAPNAEFLLNVDQRMNRRNPVRQYFLKLIKTHVQEGSLPPLLVTGDEETDKKIKNATSQLMGVFGEHKEKIQGIRV